jgi:magnesium transporter
MASDRAAARRLIRERFLGRYPGEAAELLEGVDAGELTRFLLEEPPHVAAPVLERLTPGTAAPVVAALPETAVAQLLPRLDPQRAAVILSRLDAPAREAVLAHVDRATADDLGDLLRYPPDSAGALMDARFTAYRRETTVADAVARLRRDAAGPPRELLLIDAEGRLVGAVDAADLLLAEPATRLDALGRPAPATVLALARREEVVSAFEQATAALPVVDLQGRLLGVVRAAAVLQAAQEEATADLQMMVGAGKEERALSRVSFAVRRRLPWLEVNLATAFLASAVVGLFEGTISRFTALAVLLPVVAGQSGNTGAQALAVTMRGLALREVRARQWTRIVTKEASVGLVNGVAVALTTALAVLLWSGSPGLALVIGTSMVLSMVVASLAGATIPILLTVAGQDPAQSSSIVLTTVTDVAGFFSFLGIATLLAGML